jgi:hypothetical protein
MTVRYAFAIGIDPGPTTGIVLLHLSNELCPRHKAPCGKPGDCAEVFQCNEAAMPWLLANLLGDHGLHGAPARAQCEAFARGRSAGAHMAAGRRTADQVERVTAICSAYGVPLAQRNAATAKPWAERNDCRRLKAAGLMPLAKAQPHAKSALSHALFCAVHDCGYPDPLDTRTAMPFREGEPYDPGSG